MTVAIRLRNPSATLPPIDWSAVVPTVAGLALVWTAIGEIDPGAVTDAGLISVLPARYVLALILLVAGFVRSIHASAPNRLVLAGQLVAFTVATHGLSSMVSEHPRFFSGYLHAGFVEYVQRNGAIDPLIDGRFNWPGGFTMAALVSDGAGFDDALWFLRWSPVLFNLVYLVPLWVIARKLVGDERHAWVTLWVFLTFNWIGQDYFAPQALAMLLYLGILAIALRRFESAGDLVDVSPKTSTGLRLVVVGAAAAMAMSHQLTPVVLVISLSSLVLVRRLTLRALPVFVAVTVAMWISLGAVTFWQGHLDLIVGGVGDIGGNVNSGLSERATEEGLQRSFMLRLRIAMTGLLILAAMLGWGRRWLEARDLQIPAVALAVAPFSIIALQAYGGEAILRAAFLATPPASVLIASALVRHRPADELDQRTSTSGRALLQQAAIVALGTVFAIGLIWTRFGNERFERVEPAEFAAVSWIYDNAPPGSTLVAVSRNVPWRFQDLERYTYTPIDDALLTDPEAVAGYFADRPGPAYLFLSRDQETFGQALYGLPPEWMQDLRADLDDVAEFIVVFEEGGTAVLRYQGEQDVETRTGAG